MTSTSYASLPEPPFLRKLAFRVGNRLRQRISSPVLTPLLRSFTWRRRGNVVMFHIGRSGSTVLAGLLRQNPHVFWDGELFDGYWGRSTIHAPQRSWTIRYRWKDSRFFPDAPFGLIRSRMPLAGFRRYYGFEAKFYHVTCNGQTLPSFVSQLEELGFTHFLVLERRHFLRKVVSSLIAEQTQQFHLAREQKPQATPVHVDPERLEVDGNCRPMLEYFEEWESQFLMLKALLRARSSLWLDYKEDILQQPLAAYRRCCEFLEISPYRASVRLARTNPFSLSELVSNWREVVAALAETRYKWMVSSEE
jgi:hypothetical protein